MGWLGQDFPLWLYFYASQTTSLLQLEYMDVPRYTETCISPDGFPEKQFG
jgi:hypothetical protein